MSIEETIEKYIEVKERISDLEKKQQKYKELIEEYLLSKGASSLDQRVKDDLYNIKKTMCTKETISKKDLPVDIWEKYCSTSRYSMLTVKKIDPDKKTKKKKSL